MTKIDIDVNNVNVTCLNRLAQVSRNVSLALNSLHSVDLPFYCGSLNDSINSLNSVNDNIKEADKKLRNASDFVTRNENAICSELNCIPGWKPPR